MGSSVTKHKKQWEDIKIISLDNKTIEQLNSVETDQNIPPLNGKFDLGENVSIDQGDRSHGRSEIVIQSRSISRAQSEPLTSRCASRVTVSRLYSSKSPDISRKLTIKEINDDSFLGKKNSNLLIEIHFYCILLI